MYVFRKNYDDAVLSPIAPFEARKLLDSNKAYVVSKFPFVIKMEKNDSPEVTKGFEKKNDISIFLYINIVDSNIEFICMSNKGHIYFHTFSIDINGIFHFIQKYLPIDYTIFQINGSNIHFIDNETQDIQELKDYSINYQNISDNHNYCTFCYREFDLDEYRIFKVIREHSFYGNNILICNSCINRLRQGEKSGYMRYIEYLYEIEKETLNLYKNYFLRSSKNE
jgi:hypothetical protein